LLDMSEKERILQLLCTDKTVDEQVICLAAFRAILGGKAIDRAGLIQATGFNEPKVDALLAGLTGRGLLVIESGSGRVVGSWGLSIMPTDHKLRIRGRELYTWCAVDAVGIPAGLGEDAIITSKCSQCGVPVRVEMVAGQVGSVEPAGVQLWVTAGQMGRSVVGFT
jgi:alkylmercury lyase